MSTLIHITWQYFYVTQFAVFLLPLGLTLVICEFNKQYAILSIARSMTYLNPGYQHFRICVTLTYGTGISYLYRCNIVGHSKNMKRMKQRLDSKIFTDVYMKQMYKNHYFLPGILLPTSLSHDTKISLVPVSQPYTPTIDQEQFVLSTLLKTR